MAEHAELNEDFRDLLACLVGAHVDFVIVGAHALAAHGLPRATGDIDVLVRPTPANAELVMRALAEFGAPTAAHGISAADFAKPGQVYQLGLPPRRIDLLTSVDGVSFEDAFGSRIEVSVGGLLLPFLGRDALIANKRAAGRPKDLVDLEALLGR
ncbi:hypothetical protein BH11MYX4_BH11MYX4_43890 [soil metagenome]